MTSRTSEFVACAEVVRKFLLESATVASPSLDNSYSNNALGLANRSKAPQGLLSPQKIASRSALYQQAKALSKSIKKLELNAIDLRRLVEQSTLFADPSDEINLLTKNMKADIFHCNECVVELFQGIEKVQYPQLKCHWISVGDVIKAHLLEVTSSFQESLKLRAKRMETDARTRSRLGVSRWVPPSPVAATASSFHAMHQFHPYSHSNSVNEAPVTDPFDNSTTSSIRKRGGIAASSTYPSVASPAAPVSHKPKISYTFTPTNKKTDNVIDPESLSEMNPQLAGVGAGAGAGAQKQNSIQSMTYRAISRLDEMRAVERTISELGSTFTKLANLVSSQGETIERIDNDTLTAETNVNDGYFELMKFYESMQKHRSWIIKVFLILLFVILLLFYLRG
jgi:SNARE domain